MPRDCSHHPSRTGLRHRASSPVTALAAFSALVAVSVAVSSGISPDAGSGPGSAFGAAAASAEQPGGAPSLLAAGREQQSPPPAGPPREARSVSPVRDGAAGDGSWRPDAVRGEGSPHEPSTVRPGRQAPRLYEGELPVNTLIAPARPGAVLPGGTFGWRIAPDRGGREFHNGTDVSAAAGLPVVAALGGEVTAVFWDVWGGNRVELTHADGVRTTYSHLEDVRVRVGDRLAASEQLGSVGATGTRVTGPHLHFETWVNGQAVDPQSFDWVDGMRVIPASRAKYSLEVPEPEVPDDGRAVAAPAAPSEAEQAAKDAATRKAEQEKAAQQKAEGEKAVRERAAAEKAAAEKAAAEKAVRERAAAEKAAAEKAARDRAAAEKAATGKKPIPSTPAPTPPTPALPAPVVPAPTPPAPAVPAPETDEPVDPAQPQQPAREPGVAERVLDGVRNTDGDTLLDVVDPDLDGDKIDNHLDPDLDGDKIDNVDDPDLDGDGLRNGEDPDRDGDGLPNGKDPEPERPARQEVPAPAAGKRTEPSAAGGAAAAPAAGTTPAADAETTPEPGSTTSAPAAP